MLTRNRSHFKFKTNRRPKTKIQRQIIFLTFSRTHLCGLSFSQPFSFWFIPRSPIFFFLAYTIYRFIQKSFILIIGWMDPIHNLEIKVSFHLWSPVFVHTSNKNYSQPRKNSNMCEKRRVNIVRHSKVHDRWSVGS